MAAVGLLYVGAVLFLNGVMLLGRIDAKSGGVFNLFVGALQVVTPTYLIIRADGNTAAILAAAGIYLFGFTYLYVGITNLAGLDPAGIGWYSLFVAVVAVGLSAATFTVLQDSVFGVIWLYWALLWFLFFLLLAAERPIQRFTGWACIGEAWVTCVIPAYLILTGALTATTAITAVLVALAVLGFPALYLATGPNRVRSAGAPTTEPGPPSARQATPVA